MVDSLDTHLDHYPAYFTGIDMVCTGVELDLFAEGTNGAGLDTVAFWWLPSGTAELSWKLDHAFTFVASLVDRGETWKAVCAAPETTGMALSIMAADGSTTDCVVRGVSPEEAEKRWGLTLCYPFDWNIHEKDGASDTSAPRAQP